MGRATRLAGTASAAAAQTTPAAVGRVDGSTVARSRLRAGYRCAACTARVVCRMDPRRRIDAPAPRPSESRRDRQQRPGDPAAAARRRRRQTRRARSDRRSRPPPPAPHPGPTRHRGGRHLRRQHRYADTTTAAAAGIDNLQSGRWNPPTGSLLIIDDADQLPAEQLHWVTTNTAATNTKLLLVTNTGAPPPRHTLTDVLARHLPWAQHLGAIDADQQRSTAMQRTAHHLAATPGDDTDHHTQARRLSGPARPTHRPLPRHHPAHNPAPHRPAPRPKPRQRARTLTIAL